MKGSRATCGCAATGSSTVMIEGRGAVRATCDTAKGLIVEGVPTVTVEGYPISVMGDPVVPHGRGRCGSATTAGPCRTVLIGEGDGPRRAGNKPSVAKAAPVRVVEHRCRGQVIYEQRKAMTCAIAGAQMIIRQEKGTSPTEAALEAEAATLEIYNTKDGTKYPFYSPKTGTLNYALDIFLQRHGISAHTLTSDVLSAELVRTITYNGTRPAGVTVRVTGGLHFVVIDGLDAAGNILYRDPGTNPGCSSAPLADFARDRFVPGGNILMLGPRPSYWSEDPHILRQKKKP